MKRLAILAVPLACLLPVSGQDKITYDDHVKELFRAQCFKCHNPDDKKGDLDLSTYTATMLGGGSGSAVEAGNPDASFLYTVMTHAEEPPMPPKSPKRPDSELSIIKRWIDGGLLENASSTAKKPTRPKVDLALKEAPSGRPEGPPPMPRDLLLEPVLRTGRTSTITAMHASPWAPVMAVGGQQQILLYHTETLELLGILPFPEGEPHSLRFSTNGKFLLAGGGVAGNLGTTVLYNLETGARLLGAGEDFDSILASDVSGDLAHIVTGGPDKLVKIYSTDDPQPLHRLKKHTDWVLAAGFSPDAILVASGDRNGNLFVWESGTGILFYDLRGHKGAVTQVAWRPDSNVLASGSEDGTIKLWNMHDGKLIKSWNAHGGGVTSVMYSMDGRIVSVGRDKTAKLWDANGAQQKAFSGLSDVATAVSISHDGQRVFAGDWNGHVLVFNAEDGAQVGDIDVNPPAVEEQIKAIKARIAEVRKPWDAAVAAVAPVKAEADKVAATLPAAEQAMAQAAKQKADMEAQLAAAREKVNQAQAAVNASQGKVTATQQRSQQIAGLREGLAKALASAQENLKQLEALKAAAAEPDKALVDQSIQVAQKSAAEFDAKVKAAQGQVDQANQAVNVAKQEVAKMTGAMQAASQAVTEAQNRVNEGAKQVAAATQARDAKNKEVAAARARVAEAEKKAAAARPAELDNLQQELKKYEVAKFNLEVEAARKKMVAKETELQALQQQLEAAKAAAAAEKGAYEAKKAEYEKLKQP